MINKDDLIIERITGKKKAGGANRNCVNSCVRITHKPTGIVVKIDGRDQSRNYQMGLRELEKRLKELKQEKEAQSRKERRDRAIKDDTVIRTYKFKEGLVIDHRSGKRASLKDVLIKGNIELLRAENA